MGLGTDLDHPKGDKVEVSLNSEDFSKLSPGYERVMDVKVDPQEKAKLYALAKPDTCLNAAITGANNGGIPYDFSKIVRFEAASDFHSKS